MAISLQKASMFKRISAWLFDAVMCVVLATGLLAVMSAILHYDEQANKLNECYEQIYDQYEFDQNVKLDLTEEAYNALDEEAKKAYDAHLNAVNELIVGDEEIQRLHTVIVSYTFLMVTVSLLIANLVWNFLLPLILHDGRSLGKKIFGLAVMRTNGLKISNPVLFVRSILGLYTMETMVPVLFALMIYFGMLGSVGVIAAVMMLVLEIAVMATTKTHSSIHCLLSDTVVVDYASQRIFATQADLDAYLEKQRIEEEQKKNSDFNQ